MKRRHRSITLSGEAPPGGKPRPGPGEMLICVYEDPELSLWQVEACLGRLELGVRGEREPQSAADGVQLARELISQLDFEGPVRWQIGRAGPVTKEPRP